MKNHESQLGDFFNEVPFDDTPDHRHRDAVEKDLLSALVKAPRRQSAYAEIGRTIMKTTIAKLATAALIAAAAMLAVSAILHHGATAAWAIEDTVKALDQFTTIYVSGVLGVPIEKIGGGADLTLRNGQTWSIELWMQANAEKTRSENYRIDIGDGTVLSVYNGTTYRYDPKSHTVRVQPGRGIEMSPWPRGDFLSKLREQMQDWQVMYGKDATTGHDYAFITYANPVQNQSWWLEIDLETNLPARAKGWNNMRREGTPSIDCKRLVFFERVADTVFEYHIPEGATVLEN